MTTPLLQQALEALEVARDYIAATTVDIEDGDKIDVAITAIQAHLSTSQAVKDSLTTERPPYCGTSHCSCVECVVEPVPGDGQIDEGVCEHCNGAGSVTAMTYGHGPDDYEYDASCEACGGTGSPDIRDAMKSLPYQPDTVKPHEQMVSRSAVLRLLDLHGITKEQSNAS